MFEYELCLSNKRKSLAIVIKKNLSIKVFAPKRCDKNVIHKFVSEKQNWVEKTIEKLKNKIELKEINTEYSDNSIFLILGQKYYLSIIDNSKKNYTEIIDNKIIIYRKNNSDIEKIIKKYFLKIASEKFSERLDICYKIFINHIKCDYPTLKIKFMKSRWGSMSSKGIISLNAKLIYYKTDIIDYVIMHELCHIKHQNHGRKFYKLFETIVPNWKDYKKELSNNVY